MSELPTTERSDITIRSLLEAGVHFGHQVSRWNPKMKPYLFTARNGIHIIDLEQTLPLLKKAGRFIADQVARGGDVLFVGTKPQAQDVIAEEVGRVGMHYVNHRWLGGMLTNFKTIKRSIDRLRKYNEDKENGVIGKLNKREQLTLEREAEKKTRSLGGIKDLNDIPAVVVIIDPNREHIAKREANRLRIPVVALADSNCDPDGIDFLIPGNDDALRSIRLVTTFLVLAVEEGMNRRQQAIRREVEEESAKRGSARSEERQIGARGKAYVAEKPVKPGSNRKTAGGIIS